MSSEITFVFDTDANGERIVRWKPAGAGSRKSGGGGDANWVDGPECPTHGAWNVVPRKDGSGFFYSCKVAKGEDWCTYKAGRPWTENNPPTPQEEDSIYTSDEDLFG
jgi:hypothetical protein